MLSLGLGIGTIALSLELPSGEPVAYTIELNPVYTDESGTTYTNEAGTANYTIELPPVYVTEDGTQTYTTEG